MKTSVIATAMVFALGLTCVNAYAEDNQLSQTSINNGVQMQTSQDTNKAEGEVFLAKNKLNADVITLPSGLQYKVLTNGTGAKPSANDTVVVHYAGKLIDGTEFDSSYKRGEPTSFPVNAVISGWTEALQLMSVGSTWELYIPSGLAYGPRGMPPVIGQNQVLIFKVELLGIKK